MAGVDLVDETFIVVAPDVLATVVADPANWRIWWPDLQLSVFMDRGVAGQRWSVTGSLVGSLEIWIEPFADGCIVHHYLRAEPSADGRTPDPWPDTPAGWRTAARHRERRAKAWKRTIWELKRRLEGDRPPGVPPSRSVQADGGPAQRQ
ncbi:MAG TPA: polyketide cyclase / dehydrase and lipid transport [Actinomycetota bacterium]|nr:polyketide cyclase / dehydrase and lipid transport [Actinomycetota bacterium]